MKKLLFVMESLGHGGVLKVLIEVFRHLRPEEFSVTLLIMYSGDERFLKLIPSYVRIINLHLEPRYYFSSTPEIFFRRLQRGRYAEAAGILFRRLFGIGLSHANTDLSDVPGMTDCYDCAVCYHMHSAMLVRYVAEKVSAARKVCWIHNDFTNSGYHVEKIRKYLDKYDCFAAVAEKTGQDFLKHCPWLEGKVRVVYNLSDRTEIRRKAEEPIDESYFHEQRLRLLTVGRMEEQKGFDIAVRAAGLMRKQGLDFAWYLIGAGSREAEIRSMICRHGLQNSVFCLGEKMNPYPYMKNCDIYVQPSRHEGFCMTVGEALMLARPVICFDFFGGDEQIRTGENGLIVSPSKPKPLAEAICQLAADRDTRERFIRVLQEKDTGNEDCSKVIECFS